MIAAEAKTVVKIEGFFIFLKNDISWPVDIGISLTTKRLFMIRIVCALSPVTLLPVRTLLDLLQFHPQSIRQRAAYALLYPFSARHRKVLQSLSYVEWIPEVQFIGVVTQWRVKRWLTWLAQAIAPYLANKRIFFYSVEHMDEPTRLFLELLYPHVASGTINLMYGQPSRDGAYSAHHANCLTAEERSIVDIFQKDPRKLVSDEVAILDRAGVSAMLSANWWQVYRMFSHIIDADPPRAHHAMGIAERFLENHPAAEWHLGRASELEGAVDRIQVLYARALLHLRGYEPRYRDIAKVRQCLKEGYRILEEERLPREGHVFSRVLLNAACSFVEFREGRFEDALATLEESFSMLSSMPDSPQKGCSYAFALGNKAQTLRGLNRIDEACEINAKLVHLDAQMPIWWEEYAKCLYELNRFDQLQSVLNEGLALHYDSARLHEYQGKFFQENGQHAHSANAFRRAAKYAATGEEAYLAAAEGAWKREEQRNQARSSQKHAV